MVEVSAAGASNAEERNGGVGGTRQAGRSSARLWYWRFGHSDKRLDLPGATDHGPDGDRDEARRAASPLVSGRSSPG